MSEMRTENWMGYDIRFIEQDGEWWAILKDICNALELKTFKVSQRLDPDMMMRVRVDVSDIPLRYNESSDHLSKVDRSKGENRYRWMLAVNEIGIYEALYSSKKLEARKFRRWTATVLKKLRRHIGLEGYEVMRMADQDVQDDIDHFLDDLFYDEETGQLMQSVTVQGGDVEQIPFEF
jgi:prophage antirepressor-like protein